MSYYSVENGPTLNGDAYSGRGTVVPYEFLENIMAKGAPLSLSSATVTLNASVTDPFPIWLGDSFHYATTSTPYTFAATGNPILSSAGVETTGALATDVWYLYAGLNSSNVVTIYPSQTAPAKADFRFNKSVFGHPGTSATKSYTYFGHVICTNSGTPAFVPFTKVGRTYLIPTASKLEQATTDDTNFVSLAFTGVEGLPSHSGVSVGGWGETAASDTIEIAYDASGSGATLITGPTNDVGTSPFNNMPLNSGQLFARHGTAAGDVHITSITDIV